MGSKKKTTTTSNSTSTAAPPAWTLPGLEYAGQLVTDTLKANTPSTPYKGNFVATMPKSTVTGLQNNYNKQAATAQSLSDFARQQMTSFMQPEDSQELLQSAITAAIDPTYKMLQEQLLPSITNSALASGAYSNDRALGVVPTQVIRDANSSAQRIGAELGYQGYQAEQARDIQRNGMLPGLTQNVLNLGTQGAGLQSQAAQIAQQAQQQALNNAIAKHQYAITAPYEAIAPAAQLLTQLSGNYGTQTGSSNSTTVEKTGGLGSALQGAMGIASMAGSLGAFGPLGGAMGPAAAAAGGAVAPMANPFAMPISSFMAPQPSMNNWSMYNGGF